jgi:hypothetical protein
MAVWTNILSGMIMDSGDFAYPDGLDWELHDYEQYSYIAWLAAHFDDPVARWDDGRLAQLTRYRQQINGNGEFVGPSGGGFYREAVEARRVAICWLQWNFADYPNGFSRFRKFNRRRRAVFARHKWLCLDQLRPADKWLARAHHGNYRTAFRRISLESLCHHPAIAGHHRPGNHGLAHWRTARHFNH